MLATAIGETGEDTTCQTGHTGALCGTCKVDLADYRNNWALKGDTCVECYGLVEQIEEFFGWVLLLAIVLTVIGVTISWSLKLKVVGDCLPNLVKSRGVQAVASGKIMLTAFQMLSLIWHSLAFRLQGVNPHQQRARPRPPHPAPRPPSPHRMRARTCTCLVLPS